MSFMSWLQGLFVTPPAAPAPSAPASTIPGLRAGFGAALPDADPDAWLPIFLEYMPAAWITTPRRVAAFLGNVSVEAGPGLEELAEDTDYTSSARLCAVFPDEFPTLASTVGYVGDPVRIANRAYANKDGNGDEASGDGYALRGSGCLQLTAVDDIAPFAASVGMTDLRACADYCRAPDGAVKSAVWYWTHHNLNALADPWELSKITLAINGAGMEGNAERVAAANKALAAIIKSIGASS